MSRRPAGRRDKGREVSEDTVRMVDKERGATELEELDARNDELDGCGCLEDEPLDASEAVSDDELDLVILSPAGDAERVREYAELAKLSPAELEAIAAAGATPAIEYGGELDHG